MIFAGTLKSMTVQRGYEATGYITRAILDSGLARFRVRLQGWQASDFADTAVIGSRYITGGRLEEFRTRGQDGIVQLEVDLVPYMIEKAII